MKTTSKQMISFLLAILLAILLYLSVLPATPAAANTPAEDAQHPEGLQQQAASGEANNAENPDAGSAPAPDSEGTEDTTPAEPESPDVQETPAPVEQEEELPPADEAEEPLPVEEIPETEEPLPVSPGLHIQPILTAVVDEPLIKVVYQFGSGPQTATPTNITVTSSHSYYTLGMVDGDSMVIAANHFPGEIPASPDSLSVLLDGDMDVTMDAQYDPSAGRLYLPARYMGHRVTVVWTLAESSVANIAVSARVNVKVNGVFEEQTHTLTLSANADTIKLPLPEGENAVVSQNGIDLPGSAHYVEDGVLYVAASPLGGDITVTAYAEAPGMLPYSSRSTRPTQVVHTRSADRIWYGYYPGLHHAAD